MTKEFDFIVIGGGSGGYAAARTARQYTDSVAIVDGAEELGGLCILRGCMPSKTLIYSAEVLHLSQMGKAFGLNIPSAAVDMNALHKRKLDVIAEFAEYRQEQLHADRFSLFQSQARFIDSHTIELCDGTILKGKKFLIATGSTVQWPQVPGLKESQPWTSDEVLELDFLPEKVIVLGGGIVACELAQFLNRIGTEVIQIQRSSHILKEMSEEASLVVEQAFADEKLRLFTDTSLQEVRRLADGSYQVEFVHEGKTIVETAPHLFNALGRTPNVESLGLEQAGVSCRSSGHIETNADQQTAQPHIYAVGDCAGPHEIVHIAILQGELAGNHAFGKPVTPIEYDHLLGVVFTDPQVAFVGLSRNQIEARGIEFLEEDYPFDDHGKSILMEAKYGYVKIFAEAKTGKLLGAECVGKDAGELIHAMTYPVSSGATVFDLLKSHWYHPTLSEIWTYPIEDIADSIKEKLA